MRSSLFANPLRGEARTAAVFVALDEDLPPLVHIEVDADELTAAGAREFAAGLMLAAALAESPA